MLDLPELHVRNPLTSRLLENGTVIVWPPLGPPIALSREHFGFLAAFGTGATTRTAAVRAGLEWNVGLDRVANSFVTHGLLDSPISQALSAATDQRNAIGRRFFDEGAESWTSYSYNPECGDYFTFNRLDRTLQWLNQLSPARDASVLDLGCGAGHFAVEAGRAGYSVKGIDSSKEMIRLARERLSSEVSEVRARVSFECADAIASAQQCQSEFVTALGLLAWFDNPIPLFQTARDSVRTGGYFILDCANKLVTPDGVMWLLQRDLLDDSLSDLLLASTSLDMGERTELIRAYARQLLETAHAIQKWLASGLRIPTREASGLPAWERRFSPSEIKQLSDRTHFDVVTLAGVGEGRTLWNHVFADDVSALMNRPLAALRGLPVSALWSTGFVALLRAR